MIHLKGHCFGLLFFFYCRTFEILLEKMNKKSTSGAKAAKKVSITAIPEVITFGMSYHNLDCNYNASTEHNFSHLAVALLFSQRGNHDTLSSLNTKNPENTITIQILFHSALVSWNCKSWGWSWIDDCHDNANPHVESFEYWCFCITRAYICRAWKKLRVTCK